jgi:hypothetical protein
MGQKHSPMSKDVDMSGRAMKHLQPAVTVPTFQRLAAVDLHDNNLHEIDEPIPAQLREKPPICETLTDLDLSQNKLRVLPDEICNLVALVRLKLDRNRLEGLPLLFSQLFKLEKLTVSYNFLRSLPPNMGAMKNLRVRVTRPNFFAVFVLCPCCSLRKATPTLANFPPIFPLHAPILYYYHSLYSETENTCR